MFRTGRALGRLALRTLLLVCLVVGCLSPLQAGVLLQGFYWDVPSPAAGNAAALWWWDRLAGQANDLRKAGFTAVWIPPVLKASAGGFSVGYDPFDDYDIGSKNQRGSVPTRYGTREQLARCVAMLRANGLDVCVDMVLNHRNGDDGNFNFLYADAYGNTGGGRFEKHTGDFHPNVPQDPDVPNGNNEDSFGRDVAHVNGDTGRTSRGFKEAGDWLTKALDLQGYRLDYVKGISASWLRDYLNYGTLRGKFAVGEFFDGDLDKVSRWVRDSMQNRATAFDFPLRSLLHAMCARNGAFNMGSLDHAGLAGRDPLHAVTFVENHDTDRSEPVVKGKMLAYAYILTAEGYPSVFYRDYSTESGCYGLKPQLDPLIWIHEKLAAGETRERWKDGDVFAYERLGGKHLLVGLNDNPSAPRTVRVLTGFSANTRLHDYTGHQPDVTTGADGSVDLTIPANSDGSGYVAYSVAGIKGGFIPKARSVTQETAGAADLDVKPADNTDFVLACRLWCAPGKTIRGALYFDTKDWTPQTRITLELRDPTGALLQTRSFAKGTKQGTALQSKASLPGWFTFRIRSSDTPPTNLRPAYWLKATYTAPQTLEIK